MVSLCLTTINRAEYREELYRIFLSAAEKERNDMEYVFASSLEDCDVAEQEENNPETGSGILYDRKYESRLQETKENFLSESRALIRSYDGKIMQSRMNSSEENSIRFRSSMPIAMPYSKKSAPNALPLAVSELFVLSDSAYISEDNVKNYRSENQCGSLCLSDLQIRKNLLRSDTYYPTGYLREIGKRWKYTSKTVFRLLKEYLCAQLSLPASAECGRRGTMSDDVFLSKKSVCLLS